MTFVFINKTSQSEESSGCFLAAKFLKGEVIMESVSKAVNREKMYLRLPI